MKKIIITASCIAVLTLFAVILVSEKGETIAKKDAITVDNKYSVEEKTVYKVISESLDVSYIHSNDEKREDSNVIVEQNDEVLSDNEEMQKNRIG